MIRIYLVLLLAGLLLPAMAADAEYRLSAQDKITVTVLKHPELSQSYTVPPDGVIDFPRAGRINVLGKTTAELTTELRTELEKVLRTPEVTVVLVDTRPKSVYVLGAVVKPAQYPLTEGLRITELLAAAGDIAGEREGVTANLVRGKTVIPIELEAVLQGRSPDGNLVLQEGDLLWVQAPEKITVVVSGPVKSPGAMKLKPASTVRDALAQAGDVTDRRERMRLSLLRGQQTTALDWNNLAVKVLDGDVVLVEQEPVARIYVDGKVKNPGVFELPEGGGVLEAIALAGGIVGRAALGQVTIMRKGGATEQVNLIPVYIDDIPANASVNPKLAGGDKVIVPESTATISVFGMVRNPGSYPIDETREIRLIDAISMAGGGLDKLAQMSRVGVIRQKDGTAQLTEINVDDITKKGKIELNVKLEPKDIVYVPKSKTVDWRDIMRGLSEVGILLTL